MPQKLKFFALFSMLFLISLALAAEEPKEESETSFTIMGDVRWRYEFRDNADFDETSNDATNFHLGRARVGVKAEATENTWGFIQVQDARFWGEEVNFAGQYPFTTYDGSADNLDVHQAFIKVDHLWDSNFGVKIGRQELSYGDERLIGADGWNNLGQSFDGGKATFTSEYFDFDVFYTQHVPWYPTFTVLNPAVPGGIPTGANLTFSGFYGTAKPIENLTWDGYLLLLFDGSTAPDKSWFWTFGTRAAGTLAEHLDYTGEFAFQTGNFGAVDQSAFALAVKAGYTFPVQVEPRVGVDFALATGDDGTDPTESNTFFSLFPSPHGKFGSMDYQDWSNMLNLGLKFSVKPSEQIKAKAGFNFFWLDEEADAWYQPYGFAMGLPTGTSTTIGNELDLGFSYDYNTAVGFMAGYSHFFPGEHLDDNGLSDASDWFYVSTMLKF